MNPEVDSHLVLEVRDLTKSFGDFIANDNITFDVRKGDIHCLLGENGAGKSTLILTHPPLGCTMPMMVLIKVDLPAPFGPTTPTSEPASTTASTP